MEVALAGGAVAVTRFGQVLDVDVDEADLVVLERAMRLAGLLGRWRPVERRSAHAMGRPLIAGETAAFCDRAERSGRASGLRLRHLRMVSVETP
jgi:hypothetical protein